LILDKLQIIATVTLDFYTNNIKTINVKQCDTGSRFILVSFTEHGKKVGLNMDTMSVITRYKKADGKFGLKDCKILEDGTVLIETNEQMLAASGRCRLDVVILESSGLKVENYCDVTSLEDINCAVLSSMPLDLNVVASPISKDELESEYDFTALNSALFETKEAERDLLAKHAEWAVKESERQENEVARQDAEKEREKNVQDTIDKCNTDVQNTIEECNTNVQNTISECEKQVGNTIDECNEKIDKTIEGCEVATNDAVLKANQATVAATNATNAANTATTGANTAAENANTEAQNCKNVYDAISENAGIVIDECETARDRANVAAKECEGIVAGTGMVMQTEKGVAGGIPVLDENGKVPTEQLPEFSTAPDWNQADSSAKDYIKNKIPISNGSGSNSIVIATGDAQGKYSIAGGTNDTSLVSDMIGILGSLASIDKPTAYGNMSLSFGAGTKALSSGTVAMGANTSAGCKGFYYWSIDFTNRVITLSTNQKPLGTREWTDEAKTQLRNWAKDDIISIVNNNKYVMCSKITAIDTNAGTITVDSLPFTEIKNLTSPSFDDYSIVCPAKPTIGIVNLGLGAFAIGLENKAVGSFSHVEGRNNTGAGDYSHVEGRNNIAGYASHAEGRNTIASGEDSHVEGYKTEARGNQSHAEGWGCKATNKQAHAEGDCTEASGEQSHAEGELTKATNTNSHAEGYNTYASGKSSHAEGGNTIVLGECSHGEGYNTKSMTSIGVNVRTATENEILEEWRNSKFGLVKNKASHGEGQDTLALGLYSHTEGYQTAAISEASHAEGKDTEAGGVTSHAEGWKSKASGESSHAEGYNTEASGNQSHAEGYGCKATNTQAHAEGDSTTASGDESHAEGCATVAKGKSSHSEGYKTIAGSNYQHVQGRWNVEDTENKYAHIVGGGSSDTDRKNIHTLDWDGNAWYKSISLGGTYDKPVATIGIDEENGFIVFSFNSSEE